MNGYTRLTAAEREEISRHLAAGVRLRAMARQLGRAPSTVSRELRRTGHRRLPYRRRHYRALPAQRLATRLGRRRRRPRRLVVNRRLRAAVVAGLAQRWSPEQIATRLAAAYPDDATMRISHETIYTYLYVLPRGQLRRELLATLRQRHKRRRARRSSRAHERRGQLPDMISIEARPAEVADRTVPGHWEGDLLMGRRSASAWGTLVERTTRTTLLVPLKAKDATSVRRAFAREMRTLPQQMRRSLTYDRGKEMAEHRLFAETTGIKVYFAHPQSPWERGTNENTNGLLRQFFPKRTDFSTISRREIKHVQNLMTGRPRKGLSWRTPSEAFYNLPGALGTWNRQGNSMSDTISDTTAMDRADLWVGGNLKIENQGTLRLLEAAANGTNYMGFQAAASLSADRIWTLPINSDVGYLLNDGAGILSWGGGLGDVTGVGDCVSGDCFEPNTSGTENTIYFEGAATDSANEVALTAAEPASADVTVALPIQTTTLIGTGTADTLSNKTLTAPKIVDGDALMDANGNEVVKYSQTPNVVDEVTLANAAANANPIGAGRRGRGAVRQCRVGRGQQRGDSGRPGRGCRASDLPEHGHRARSALAGVAGRRGGPPARDADPSVEDSAPRNDGPRQLRRQPHPVSGLRLVRRLWARRSPQLADGARRRQWRVDAGQARGVRADRRVSGRLFHVLRRRGVLLASPSGGASRRTRRAVDLLSQV